MAMEGSQSALEAPSSEFQQNESSPPLKSTPPPGVSSFSRRMHCSYMHRCCDCGCLLRSVVLDLLRRFFLDLMLELQFSYCFYCFSAGFNANLVSLMFYFHFLFCGHFYDT